MRARKMINATVQKRFNLNLRISGQRIQPEDEDTDYDVHKIKMDRYHLVLDGRSIEAILLSSDASRKKTLWNIEGHLVEVDLLDEADLAIRDAGIDKPAIRNENVVQAPMPGQILEVFVARGQRVAEGEPLLVLNAMKMDNIIRAPRGGVIGSVEVAPGVRVEKRAPLVHF